MARFRLRAGLVCVWHGWDVARAAFPPRIGSSSPEFDRDPSTGPRRRFHAAGVAITGTLTATAGTALGPWAPLISAQMSIKALSVWKPMIAGPSAVNWLSLDTGGSPLSACGPKGPHMHGGVEGHRDTARPGVLGDPRARGSYPSGCVRDGAQQASANSSRSIKGIDTLRGRTGPRRAFSASCCAPPLPDSPSRYLRPGQCSSSGCCLAAGDA